MRGIAEELDTGAASLYWHVGSKDGLLDLIFDQVLSEQRVPEADPRRWKEQIKEVARATRAMILRHRDIVRISIGRLAMGPNGLRYSERVLAIFRGSGLPDRSAAIFNQLLFSVVNGFTLDEAGGAIVKPGQPAPNELAKSIQDYVAALPRDQFPNLVAIARHLAAGDQEERFELLLDLFVDGLEKSVARLAPGTHRKTRRPRG